MIEVMVDLETLATEDNAIVASIGAVKMDMATRTVLEDEVFYATLAWTEQGEKGRICHPDTVRWWMGQDKLAQNALLLMPERSNVSILEDFNAFYDDAKGLWGNGSDFDCSIMVSLYKTYGYRRAWSYTHHRCFRTLKNMSLCPKPQRHGVHHNALDDAVYQARWLMNILALGIGG